MYKIEYGKNVCLDEVQKHKLRNEMVWLLREYPKEKNIDLVLNGLSLEIEINHERNIVKVKLTR